MTNLENENMRAILKTPDSEELQIVEIENELKALQKAVEGWIECVTLRDGICLIVNADGKYSNLPVNCRFNGDWIKGNMLFVGSAGENFCSLTDGQIEEVKKIYKEGTKR